MCTSTQFVGASLVSTGWMRVQEHVAGKTTCLKKRLFFIIADDYEGYAMAA